VGVLTVVLAAALSVLLAQVATPALPVEIPLFPLPETTLFPGVSRPLLIYEPRYREMIADALKGNRIVGMARTTARICSNAPVSSSARAY
jgi:Lon protease-like protein